MRELVRTNDAVLVSAIEALLNGAQIRHLILDQNMSVLEGSLGILPRRVLVPDDQADDARELLREAGLGHELRPDPAETLPQGLTEDAVLGGRLRLRQPRRGHRVGHDAILLAAATAAADGDHAVDLGAGVGAAGLALARRVPGVRVTLVDVDPVLSDLADENVVENGFADRVASLVLDVTAPADAFVAAGLPPGCAQQVLMNPPFNLAQRHRASPDPDRMQAHAAAPETLDGLEQNRHPPAGRPRHTDADLACRRPCRGAWPPSNRLRRRSPCCRCSRARMRLRFGCWCTRSSAAARRCGCCRR